MFHSNSTFGSSLIFKSNFGSGVSVGKPRDFSTIGAWQDITGLDAETGYSWPITALDANFSGIQNITYDPINPDTIDSYIHNEIRTVIGPKGTLVPELFQTVKKKPVGIGSSQAPLLIRRGFSSDLKDLYISYWFKLQSNLLEQLEETVSSGNWRSIFEFKTGGFEGTGNGDYRIQTTILKRDGKLFWMNKGDSNANAPTDKVPEETFWTAENHVIPVPLGTWFKMEIYWHRSSDFYGTTGRYWAAVNGQVIVDQSGSGMMGRKNLPVGRIFVDTTYSGGHPTVDSHITGLEIWNSFPCGMYLSCFKASIVPKVNIPLLDQAFTESLPGKFVLPANTFVDPDGGTMTYSAKLVDGGIEVGLPAWLTFIPSTRTFSGTPPKLVKSYIIRVRATDDKAKSTYDDFVLKINNAPTLKSSLPDFVWAENTPASYTFPITTFSDADGDVLTYSAALTNGGKLPGWLSFNPITRTLAGTPPRGAASFNIRITAQDTNKLSVYDDMIIKINNKPHVAAFVNDQIWNENTPKTFTITSSFFQDIDGDVLTYSATLASGAALPTWMTFVPSTRTFEGTPLRGIATYAIRIKVVDPSGLSVTDDFNVTINNKPILVNPLAEQNWSEGGFHSYTIPANTFTDLDGDILTYRAALPTGGIIPSWMSFNPITRTLSGTPPPGSGDVLIRIWVQDANYLQALNDILIKTP